mgnify:CR=1 FL=1
MVRRRRPRPCGRRRHQGDQEAIAAGRFADERDARRHGRRRRTIVRRIRRSLLQFIDVANGAPHQGRARHRQRHGRHRGQRDLQAPARSSSVKMYFDLDGTFPNHPPDPLEEANRREIVERVRRGEARRSGWPGTATPTAASSSTIPAQFVPGDFVTALLGESFVKCPGLKVVHDVRASRGARPRRRAGGTALMNRVGHAFIRGGCADENAVFGGEVSGHFYFRDNWYADNGMIPALLVLELPAARPEAERAAGSAARRTVLHHRGDQLEGRGRRGRACAASRSAMATPRSRDGRRLRGLSRTGTSTCGRPITEPLLRLNLEASSHEDASGGATVLVSHPQLILRWASPATRGRGVRSLLRAPACLHRGRRWGPHPSDQQQGSFCGRPSTAAAVIPRPSVAPATRHPTSARLGAFRSPCDHALRARPAWKQRA